MVCKDALGFIVSLHLCPSVHEKRRVGRRRRQKKCMPAPVFLCHANRRAGINTGSVLTAHWVLVYYILKSKAQHSSNPSARCNPQRAVPRSGILSAQQRKKSSSHHRLYQGLNTSPGNPPPRPKLTVQSQHCS